MKSPFFRFALLGLLAAAMASVPVQSYAQNTNKTSVDKKTASSTTTNSENAAKGGPFHGKLAAVDKTAKTITVGKRTFHITSDTKIKKGGKPALLDDAVVGETVSGYVKPGTDGKLMATTLNIGPKNPASTTQPPKPAQPKETQTK